MHAGEDFILRPVIEGCIRYESLLDGSINLIDVIRINDALNVRAENERRLSEAARQREH